MKYFKNTELAKLYNVSEKSVRNWIQAAKEGKLELTLHTENGKAAIANTPKNTLIVEELIARGKKYRNSRAFKTATPLQRLYEVCTPRQVYDLVSSIDIHREIPHQYSYLNGGASHWDKYAHKLFREKTPNSVTNTIELLDLNDQYILKLCRNASKINVVDLGVGNCLPVRGMLERLVATGRFNRYIAIDTSIDMLNIAQKNIAQWFSDIHFEGHVRDISYDRFDDLIIPDTFTDDSESIINLVFFFGGTVSNLRDPAQTLRTIQNSMGKDDVFLMSRKMDTDATRRFFDFTLDDVGHDMKERYMLDMMGVDSSYYDIEQFFDVEARSRIMQARLKVDLALKFSNGEKKRTIELHKGEGITIWRSDHKTLQETMEQLDLSGYETLQASKSIDHQYSLFVCKARA